MVLLFGGVCRHVLAFEWHWDCQLLVEILRVTNDWNFTWQLGTYLSIEIINELRVLPTYNLTRLK
jgi:hypothetical protein